MVNRSANAVMFGFDFQVNAAIVLMLQNIEELVSLRLEGNDEDIEIILDDGECVFAQAKSVVKASSDFSNVREKLYHALITLSEASREANVKELILITNSLNPLNLKENVFFGESYRFYHTLPDSSKEVIDNYITKIDEPLDLNKFMIQVLPFETDYDLEKYKVVRQKVDSFIGKLDLNITGIVDKTLDIWQNIFFKNGTKQDKGIKLKKWDIIWPIICIVTDISRSDNEWLDIDDELYEEVCAKYNDIIRTYSEKFELFTRVLYDYNKFESKNRNREKIFEFINKNWSNYKNELSLVNNCGDLEKALIQVIIYSILNGRRTINRIKERVNL